jgi:transposase
MGPTDMRKGFYGLSMLAQDVLKQEPFSGHLVFRGKRGDLVKVLYWDGQGFCLLAKRLEKRALFVADHQGKFRRARPRAAVYVGIDWRTPQREPNQSCGRTVALGLGGTLSGC